MLASKEAAILRQKELAKVSAGKGRRSSFGLGQPQATMQQEVQQANEDAAAGEQVNEDEDEPQDKDPAEDMRVSACQTMS